MAFIKNIYCGIPHNHKTVVDFFHFQGCYAVAGITLSLYFEIASNDAHCKAVYMEHFKLPYPHIPFK